MKKWNKLLALLLAMVMALGMTVTAFAEEVDGAAEETPAETTETTETPAETEEPAAPAYNGTIVILHTNDVHGAIDGYAKVAALKAKYEAEGAYVLLMDAGDNMQGELEVSAERGANAVELMNLAGYDVATLGNHEFDFGYANIMEKLEKAEYKVTAANVTYYDEPILDEDYTFEAPDGTKIGVFGLLTPEAKTKTHPGKTVGVDVLMGEALVEVAQAHVDALTAAECDVIVCLAHLGVDEESEGDRSIDLLEKVTGIDLFIDGHSHSSTEETHEAITAAEAEIGDTVIASAGTKFNQIGVVTIADGEITCEAVDPSTITVAEDCAIQARADEMHALINEKYDSVKLGTTEVELDGSKPGNRTKESNLGDLVTDAMLWKAQKEGYKAVAAFTNGGGIRATIPVGEITKKNTFSVLPFGNTLAVAEVTGAQLLELLEASTDALPAAVGGFPQVSGIEYTVNTLKAYDAGEAYLDVLGKPTKILAPKTINRVTVQTVGGEPFDIDATYLVVSNDFLAAGGDACAILKDLDEKHNFSLDVFLDEALAEYIQEELGGVVTAEKYGEPAGRVTVLTSVCGYSDVHNKNWFAGAVEYATENSLIDAVDGAFLPNEAMTRADFVTALYRLAGSPAVTGENPFTDVADDAAYKDAVIWAADCGYVDGMTETTFAPEGTLQRQQIAAILYRAVKPEAAEGDLSVFVDADKIQAYATDAMKWMVAETLLKGNPDGTVVPRDAITRAQAATILQRFVEEKGLTFAAIEETEETETVPAEELTPAEPAAYIETEITFEVAEQDGVPAHTATGIPTIPTSATKDAPVPGVVMLHGTGSNLHEVMGAYDTAAQEMAKKGIATLRFNFQGIGDGNEADYVNYSFTAANLDAKAAADYLANLETVDGEKLGIMGWSQGGANALLAAAAYPETFKAVVTWAGALDLTRMFADFDASFAEATEKGSVILDMGWRTPLPCGAKWFEDVKNTDVLAEAKTITAPVLTINGEKDDVVDPASGAQIVEGAANSMSKNVIIPECDHTMNMFVEGSTAINTVIGNTVDFFVEAFTAAVEAAA